MYIIEYFDIDLQQSYLEYFYFETYELACDYLTANNYEVDEYDDLQFHNSHIKESAEIIKLHNFKNSIVEE